MFFASSLSNVKFVIKQTFQRCLPTHAVLMLVCEEDLKITSEQSVIENHEASFNLKII